ncbi:hypothetical protein D3C76_1449360 [compost metagenome]
MRFGIINIVHLCHDNPLIFDEIQGVILARGSGRRRDGRAVLLSEGQFQLLQHTDDARFLIRFQNVVEGFQFKSFSSVFFPCGDKHNKRLVGELVDVLRQQHTVQRRDIDIQKNGIDPVMLQKFQHIQPVFKRAHNLHLAVLFNQPA